MRNGSRFNPDPIGRKSRKSKMKNSNTIVAFHTGRGGRFYNAGHTTFLGEKKIGEFTYDLFISYENSKDIFEKIDGRENLEALYYKAVEDGKDAEIAREKFAKVGLDFGQVIYTDCNGNSVGLTAEEEITGIGCINIDGQYNTTATCLIEDCSDEEIKIIINSDNYENKYVLRKYAEWHGFEGYEIELMEYFDDWEEALINCGVSTKDGVRCGYIYGEENFTKHNIDEDLEDDYLEIDGVFYTKD